MKSRSVCHLGLSAFVCFFMTASVVAADSKPVKHQITGLFSTDREQDLREAMAKIPGIKLVSIDFKNAEATVEYDAAIAFPKAKPEQVLDQFDTLLKAASSNTFGVKPLRTTPLEKLKLIEIPIGGLDCKACCLAAYESIFRIEGVERATASFRDGRVTALIDPEKTTRAKLEAALKQKGVQITSP